MRFIHCADLHLDSKMSANLGKEEAKRRKAEILHTFERMVEYAAAHGVCGILIAGDMFDTSHVTATTRNAVLFQMNSHPDIQFYYLSGNHDNDNFLTSIDVIPSNLKFFHTVWTSYDLGEIVISGIDLTLENTDVAHASLVLDSGKFNIVMMHGQEGELVRIRELKNKGIDYLALGHVHAYKKEELDARGTYCYSGCLEGRGFDECGEHGFVVLDVNEATGEYSHEFVSFAKRELHAVSVDVTGCQTTSEMVIKISDALEQSGCMETALVKIILTGSLDVECEKNVDYILTRLQSRFYFVKIYDETTLKISVEDYLFDQSLKGEYVRKIMQDVTLSDTEKAVIIRYGLQAIAGEEVQ